MRQAFENIKVVSPLAPSICQMSSEWQKRQNPVNTEERILLVEPGDFNLLSSSDEEIRTTLLCVRGTRKWKSTHLEKCPPRTHVLGLSSLSPGPGSLLFFR